MTASAATTVTTKADAATTRNKEVRTAVVILNWNTKDYLERFLPGLLASMPEGAKVVVADSASTDGSMNMLSVRFPSVKQIRLDRNYGFTGGYNRAFKELCAMEESAGLEYFVLINSDVEVTPGWLEPLVQWMDRHPDCAACGPKIRSYYAKDRFEYAGAAGGCLDRFGYPFCRGRVLKRVEKDLGQYDSPTDVFWVSGACLLVRKEAFLKMGGFDDRFFAHMEEIDLCWRLQLEGKRICVVPQSTVYHIGGGTLPENSPWKLKLNYRNDLLMLENNLARTYSLSEIRELVPEKAAPKACRRARWTIFLRMCLDRCSAAVYRVKGDKAAYNAVIEAHKEYKSLRKGIKLADIQEYASTHRGISVPSLFPRWIVPLAFSKGNGIFDYLRKRI